MEDLPRAQQLKSIMQTSQPSKQKLAQMNSVFETQVAATAKPNNETQGNYYSYPIM